METGIMGQIWKLLDQGMTSGGIIAKGYKPSTIYKTQHLWRMAHVKSEDLTAEGDKVEEIPIDEAVELDPEVNELTERQAKEVLGAVLEECEALDTRAKAYEAQVAQLEQSEESLYGRIQELEAEAIIAESQRKKIQDFEREVQHHQHTEASQKISIARLQQETNVNKADQVRAEAQYGMATGTLAALRLENNEQRQSLGLAKRTINSLDAEVRELRRLKVWAGHPCLSCRRPLSGVVDHQTAAAIMEGFRHLECADRSRSRLAKK